MLMNKREAGFTLIELMIVIAIVGILASIAIPQYADYVSRARAAAAMMELRGYKTSISICINEVGAPTGCDAGVNNISAVADFSVTKNVTALTSVTNGVITATSGATASGSGGVALTIVNTPTVAANAANMVWTNSGTICNPTRGLKAGQGDCP